MCVMMWASSMAPSSRVNRLDVGSGHANDIDFGHQSKHERQNKLNKLKIGAGQGKIHAV
jgi:hypothetical protein